ncbi:MAG: MoxR family ATPase [Gammaproteobacteria bacterium]|nr:MoxR family ATPase [Gammaproteobacteria bacterium]
MPSVTPLNNPRGADPRARIGEIIAAGERVIVGKTHSLKLALTCLLAGGHLLIEDLPGVGKTTLAHLMARVLGLSFQRIQFTSDMLPADVIGVTIYDRDTQQFEFHRGPIFSQVILGDEINRATPRAQSALLEAMEERQVTVDGVSHRLPHPFFVIATQNPTYQIGTFPLPESQLDRFLMRISLGYPDRDAERALLTGQDRRTLLENFPAVIGPEELLEMQQAVGEIHTSSALLDYVQALLEFSRTSPEFATGLSPRAGLGLVQAARAWALLSERDSVMPEDVQRVLPAIAGHRLRAADESQQAHAADLLLQGVPIP